MHAIPELTAGTSFDWQRLHRTTRAQIGQQLIGRAIRYRTYAMLTAPDGGEQAKWLRVTDIDETERRGFGRVRIFLGEDDQERFVALPWSRIVEVTVQ